MLVVEKNIGLHRKVLFCLDLIWKFTKQIIVVRQQNSNDKKCLLHMRQSWKGVKREQSPFLKKLISLMPSSPHNGEHECPVTWESYDA